MRVAELTTSYPRSSGDAAGRFVADAVEHVRLRGVAVEVVGPQQYRHYGIAYGHGMLEVAAIAMRIATRHGLAYNGKIVVTTPSVRDN